MKARSLALSAVFKILEEGAYSNETIDTFLKSAELSDDDRRFFSRLVKGVIERLFYLDAVIAAFSHTPMKKMRPMFKSILRLGIYQILFMDAVPTHAAVNESVRLCKKNGFAGLSGFCNALLRKVAKERDHMDEILFSGDKKRLPETDKASFLSLQYSMPLWIVKLWEKQFGWDVTKEICAAFMHTYPLTIQVFAHKFNAKGSEEAYLESLRAAGIEVFSVPELPHVYRLKNTPAIHRIPGFAEGYFYVQNERALCAVKEANPLPGEYVLDVCGAPGGKTLYAANLAGEDGRFVIRDISKRKQQRVEKNIQASGFSNISFEVWDAAKAQDKDKDAYDLVIADVPCSGLGTLSHKPEIRYRLLPKDINSLVSLQRDILQTVSDYVKPGGRLLFCTCTINRQENEDNVDWFLEKHPLYFCEKTHLFLPNEDGADGFFYAILKKHPKGDDDA